MRYKPPTKETMRIEQYTEAIKPISTNTETQLHQLKLTAIGNYEEIEWLKKQLEKVGRLDAVVKVNFADRVKLTDGQLYDVCNMVQQWDDVKSKDRAIEELLELSLSLLHLARNKTDIENLHKEMADVRLALEHLEFKYGNYQNELNEKLEHNSKISA
jgi:hypothetical protein